MEWDDSNSFGISEYFDLDLSEIEDIVFYCIELSLFDKEMFNKFNILTNLEIQEEWLKITLRVDFDVHKKDYILFDLSKIPFYKTNKNPRLHERNIKLWKRISNNVFKRDNYTCKYCGKRGGKLEVDHVIPFSKGGSDDLSNLVTSCRHCNAQKHDKTLEEFMKWKKEHE